VGKTEKREKQYYEFKARKTHLFIPFPPGRADRSRKTGCSNCLPNNNYIKKKEKKQPSGQRKMRAVEKPRRKSKE
jgi:hypothetical protein